MTTEDAQKVALGASVGQLSLALRQAGSLHMTDSRRIGLDDLGKVRNEVESVQPAPVPSASSIVTVTRGTRERSQYEFTPSGRRELQVSGIGSSGALGEQHNQPMASETGVSQVIAKPK